MPLGVVRILYDDPKVTLSFEKFGDPNIKSSSFQKDHFSTFVSGLFYHTIVIGQSLQAES